MKLYTYGLVRGSFQLAEDMQGVRAVWRLRGRHVEEAARAVQHMQKALTQVNVRLANVQRGFPPAPTRSLVPVLDSCGPSGIRCGPIQLPSSTIACVWKHDRPQSEIAPSRWAHRTAHTGPRFNPRQTREFSQALFSARPLSEGAHAPDYRSARAPRHSVAFKLAAGPRIPCSVQGGEAK
jgi:hypothetical protein